MAVTVAGSIGLGILPTGFFNLATQSVDCHAHRFGTVSFDRMDDEKFDAIVVGAGPAGSAAALTMARAGMSVVLFERGQTPGAKNMMGGVIFREATEAVFGKFWEDGVGRAPGHRTAALAAG